jgi:hypothetical protein
MPPQPLPEFRTMRAIRDATLAARERTGKNISTRVQAGTIQIGIAQDIGTRGAVHFEPLTKWMGMEEAAEHLRTIK